MDKRVIIDVKLERLKRQIDELREILNEICASSKGSEINREVLIISQSLDELIVEYMNQVNMYKNDV